jgi:hypothetical protein
METTSSRLEHLPRKSSSTLTKLPSEKSGCGSRTAKPVGGRTPPRASADVESGGAFDMGNRLTYLHGDPETWRTNHVMIGDGDGDLAADLGEERGGVMI